MYTATMKVVLLWRAWEERHRQRKLTHELIARTWGRFTVDCEVMALKQRISPSYSLHRIVWKIRFQLISQVRTYPFLINLPSEKRLIFHCDFPSKSYPQTNLNLFLTEPPLATAGTRHLSNYLKRMKRRQSWATEALQRWVEWPFFPPVSHHGIRQKANYTRTKR